MLWWWKRGKLRPCWKAPDIFEGFGSVLAKRLSSLYRLRHEWTLQLEGRARQVQAHTKTQKGQMTLLPIEALPSPDKTAGWSYCEKNRKHQAWLWPSACTYKPAVMLLDKQKVRIWPFSRLLIRATNKVLLKFSARIRPKYMILKKMQRDRWEADTLNSPWYIITAMQ